jgi:hypothetical protein
MSERRQAFQHALSQWMDTPRSKRRRHALIAALQALPPPRGWPSALHHALITLSHGLQHAKPEHFDGLMAALGLLDLAIRDLDEHLAEQAQRHALNTLMPHAPRRDERPLSALWPPELPIDLELAREPSTLVVRGRLGGGQLLVSAQRVMAIQHLDQALSRPANAPAWMAGHLSWSHRQLVVVDGLARDHADLSWVCVVRPPMAASTVVAQFALALDALPGVGRLQDQAADTSLAPDLAALAVEIERSGY